MNSIEQAIVGEKAADALGQSLIGVICTGIIHTAGAPPWITAIYCLLTASYMLDIFVTLARIALGLYGSHPWERDEIDAQVARLRLIRLPKVR